MKNTDEIDNARILLTTLDDVLTLKDALKNYLPLHPDKQESKRRLLDKLERLLSWET